jgi:hypothetical protein
MNNEHEPQHERKHEGMSQDEARHEEDIKHHPFSKEAEEEEK